MAERRMVAIRIVDDDAFLDLPSGARLLYYDLVMRADDDGFITPRKVMRLIGSSQKDLDALVDSGFLIQFDSGVVAIVHWRASNTIRKDRYTPTVYQEEFSQLKEINGRYELCVDGEPSVVEESLQEEELGNQLATERQPDGNQMATDGCQSGNQMATKWQPVVATGKVRLGKGKKEYSLSNESSSKKETPAPGNQTATKPSKGKETHYPTLDEVKAYFGCNCLRGNPDAFWSNYAAVGWIDGAGREIVDWHALARKWSISENMRASPSARDGTGQRPRDWNGAYDSASMTEVTI